jgi:hypothetical protein
MEQLLSSVPAAEPLPETVPQAQTACPGIDALQEMRNLIRADALRNPGDYLEEVRVAVGGE